MAYLEQEDLPELLKSIGVDANRTLRLIRLLDQRAEALQAEIEARQKEFIRSLGSRQLSQADLDKEYSEILEKQKFCYSMAIDKAKLAEQLYDTASTAASRMSRELALMKNQLRQNGPAEPHTRSNGVQKRLEKVDSKLAYKSTADRSYANGEGAESDSINYASRRPPSERRNNLNGPLI